MSERQQALADVILEDPAVESLSSFIGVDGTNTTLNSGRIQINLKPLGERKIGASDLIHAAAERSSAKVPGITLYMQPVQDLTVDDRVSRTQYQYTLEDPNAAELNTWVPQLRGQAEGAAAAGRRGQRPAELGPARQPRPRPRHRLAPRPDHLDHRQHALRCLRPAPGLDHVHRSSTSTTSSSKSIPQFQQDPADLNHVYITPSSATAAVVHHRGTTRGPSFTSSVAGAATVATTTAATDGATAASGGAAPLERLRPLEHPGRTAHRQSPGTVSRRHPFLQPRAGRLLSDAVDAIDQAKKDLNMPAGIDAAFQGATQAFQASLTSEPLLILAALVTVYIILGVLYESFIHPITILSTLPSAGVGALLALMLFHNDLNVIALIGIILLIGIVQKNAIMMVDFALSAEREQGLTPEEAILPGLPASFPAHPHDHAGRDVRRTAAGPRHGHRRRTAPSARHRHRRRPDREPVAHPLHHAGDLPRLRPSRQMVALSHRRKTGPTDGEMTFRNDEETPLARTRLGTGSSPHEHLRAVHPPAHRHHAADRCHRAGRRRARFISCPFRRCRRSISPPSRSARVCPAPVRETMAASVATPLERQFGRIAGVTEMTSSSALGTTSVTLQFDLSRDIDGAARDVEAAINAARGNLPANLPEQSRATGRSTRPIRPS